MLQFGLLIFEHRTNKQLREEERRQDASSTKNMAKTRDNSGLYRWTGADNKKE
jgi:hypothetical protein